MIRAYPTIQTYTHGENIPAETYYGDRTTDAFLKHIEFELPAAGTRRRMEARLRE